ncbi:DNA methylase [Mycobacterium phage MPhalcon]|uniref:DNA methyltransferase n=1 Tax=Mycobacterium phage PhatBacter TaxID=1391181 RepID=UPI0003C98F2A|nr:DNA methyltransferase [Mycobacterium phage PhatBacter]AHB31563.1 DNA methylase [Mycobacterium phage PhatBacter]ATN89198.1 DNA methylase [Mycobacterium phage FireRed]AVP42883.1 DNA methylase [Mycobacterium phage MPhalcon]
MTEHPVLIHLGDCRDILAELEDASVDSIVTDPPYELGFMGKKWDGSGIAFDVEMWEQCLRVLKPGGHLLAFGGSRTWHRLTVAIEDAGFEIRDSIAWLYGSGFPKSLDVSKAIDKAAGAEREVIGARKKVDSYGEQAGNTIYGGGPNHDGVQLVTAPATDAAKQWQGWGTALKPAFEPIVVARKPLAGTVAANVLEHGTGALNIDACRIEYEQGGSLATNPSLRSGISGGNGGHIFPTETGRRVVTPHASGRWPTNVVLDEAAAAALDEQSGTLKSGLVRAGTKRAARDGAVYGRLDEDATPRDTYADSGGASRFFPVFKYQAKAPTKERPSYVNEDGNKVAHSTVKPLALMRWLVKLVTPPGGVVLDPFAGSGTTVEACLLEKFRCIAIENEPDYIPLIEQRLERSTSE